MSTRTEEVRTVFTWDTADVDKGVKRVESALDRLQQAEKKGGTKGHGGANGNNFAMGVRDLAEGRGVNAMQRFGHTIGATAARLSIYMLALRATGEALRFVREEMERTGAASRNLENDFVASNRSTNFTTTGSGTGTIGSQIIGLTESQRKENEQQSGLATAADMLDAMKKGNPLSQAAAASMELWNSLQGKRSPKEELAASKGRGAVYAKEQERLRGLYSNSLYGEAKQARLTAPGHDNDPFAAKRHELDLAEQVAEAEAKKVGASEQDLELVKERFDYLRKTVDAEERLAARKQEFQRQQLASRFSGASSFNKSLTQSTQQVNESRALLDSDDLTMAQRRSEQLNLQRAEGERREAVMGRYLNADGTKRRQGAINADFRRDRREERRRNRFLRLYDRGGFDPETGHRRATGDAPGSGLTTRSIQSAEGGLKADGMPKTLNDLLEVVKARLPKETK